MYPNLYYAFKDLFGVEWNWAKMINTFGLLVAISFLLAAYLLMLELKRKEQQKLITFKEEKIVVGKPATIGELITNFILGFLLGFKIIGAFLSSGFDNPQEYIFSSEGNWGMGIFLGALFAWMKWREKDKLKLDKPEERTIRVWPHERVGDIVIVTAIFSFLGAKIFHNLENLDEFMADPIGSLISFSGLTFYGGFIVGAIAVGLYVKSFGVSFKHFTDAAAPGLMLAYATGRIGCQVAGDGDWGIDNLKTNPYSWLPDWLWSYKYPHNVINEGVRIDGCQGPYCYELANPVYPTPLYETIICLILFVILWRIRKKITIPGVMFGIYLVMNGVERFFIEKIRVNTHYDIMGFQPTQAELISTLLVFTGLGMILFLKKKGKTK